MNAVARFFSLQGGAGGSGLNEEVSLVSYAVLLHLLAALALNTVTDACTYVLLRSYEEISRVIFARVTHWQECNTT